jgi:APA family basic amino acid/polyamine antiporter
MGVLTTKPVEQCISDTEVEGHQLRRDLSALDLTVFGVGVTIGTGIFVLTGVAAATKAGPAIALSFVVAGIACALAALCYAELASAVPVAGSAYTFSYATLGELIAWIIGWDLVLEFTLGAAAVAKGWSKYLVELLPFSLPAAIAGDRPTVDVPAAFVVAALTVVAIVGVKFSSRFNALLVAVKVAVVLLFIAVGLTAVKASNWSPFIPPPAKAPKAVTAVDTGTPLIQLLLGQEPLAYGLLGIGFGAAIVFFAFIGFDVIATTAEEVRRPQRDLPIGILGSLAICTALYVAVSLVLTGLLRYTELNDAAPMAKVHPTFRTPWIITLLTGTVVALVTALVDLETLADLVNIGTLFAFVLVSIGVVVLRRTRPDLPRSFRTPAVPLIPALAVLACLFLMLNLGTHTWYRFGAWMAIGLVLYFVYGRRRSRVTAGERVLAASDRRLGR